LLRVESPLYGATGAAQVRPVLATPPSLRDSGPDGYFGRRAGLVDWLLASLLTVAAFVAVVRSYAGYGHSWDEALYFKPAQAAAEWVARLALGDFSLLSQPQLDAHWGTRVDGNDPLHPEVAPVPKVLTGLGGLFLSDLTGDIMTAMRLPVAGAYAATVFLLYMLAFRLLRPDGCRRGGHNLWAHAAGIWPCPHRRVRDAACLHGCAHSLGFSRRHRLAPCCGLWRRWRWPLRSTQK
jgi:hypothetical protein